MKKIKKIVSLLLAMTMVLSMGLTAFADEETFTITLNCEKKGHTYYAYQIFQGDLLVENEGESNESKTLSNIEWGSGVDSDKISGLVSALKENDILKSDPAIQALGVGATAREIAETLNGRGNDSDFMVAFADVIYGYLLSNGGVSGSYSEPQDPEAETFPYTISNLKAGYYMVVDNGPAGTDDAFSRNILQVVANVEVNVKAEIPDIEKKIIDAAPDANAPFDKDGKNDTAAIGDEIEYEITGTVPDTTGYKYYYYIVNDTLSEGLTLKKDSFVVKISNTTLKLDEDYYVYYDETAEDGSNSFKLAFEDLKKMVDDKKISAGDPITITYTATVNNKAVIGTDPNTNTAKLEYSNKPNESDRSDKEPGVPEPGTVTGEGPEKTTKTYVTELTILKVDENGKYLTGAGFTLSGENLNEVKIETDVSFEPVAEGKTGDYYKLKDGTYTKVAPITDKNEDGYNADKYENLEPGYIRVTKVETSTSASEDKKVVGTVSDDGYLTFSGLNAGKYTLSETQAPDGYNAADDITFTITAELDANGQIVWKSNNDKISLDSANGIFDATIQNLPGSTLPSTGGTGTTIFYILGSILVIGAGVLLITRKRMSMEK